MKIIIQYKNKDIELTLEEAEKLYNDLKKIFDRETKIKWYPSDILPEPIPYSPPSPLIPQNPWPQPKKSLG